MRPKRKRRGGPKAKAVAPSAPWFPRGKFLLIPVVLAFPLVAYTVGFNGTEQRSAVQPLSELRYDPAVVATASLGEAFTLDEFRYEVRGSVPRGSVYGFQKSEGRFVEVAIAVENTGSVKAAPHAISMIDAAGTQYAQIPQFSRDGTSYSEVLDRGGLAPGGDTFFALFDVASGSAGLWLSFHAHDGTAARLVGLGM